MTNFDYTFSYQAMKKASPEAKSFIAKMLSLKMDERGSATEALNHPWFSSTYNATLSGSKKRLSALRD